MKTLSKKQKILILVSLLTVLLLIGGTAYAYFNINTSASSNGANITGSANDLGTPTMKTVTSNLYLNLNGSLMSEENAGKTYFANSNSSGEALMENPNYTLAEISLVNGTAALDCTYNFKVTASVKNAINDSSDSDILVEVAGKKMTLKEIIAAGTDGIIVSGKVKNLVNGDKKAITLSSSVINTSVKQDNLVDNFYTILIEPYNNGDTKTLSCKLRKEPTTFAEKLIDSDELWQSGLEDDGYRYAGTGVVCSYDNGNYVYPANNQDSTPTCPTLYNYIMSSVSGSSTWNYKYQTSCPSDSTYYTYSCTELEAESKDSSRVPNNFVCFGTTDKNTCTANSGTYMYRIIGVFADENGNNHVKLIKYSQLSSSYEWNSSQGVDVDWVDSDLYEGLNGSYFLTNTSYSYMQNSTWLNKVESWKWTAVNTLMNESTGPNYYIVSPKSLYLHEMNRSSKTNTAGEWTTPEAKIGLMYASDYSLSGGSSVLDLTFSSLSTELEKTQINRSILKTGWMHQSNNGTTVNNYDWTIARNGAYGSKNINKYQAWYVNGDGSIYNNGLVSTKGIRPVFYLTSDTDLSGGEGTLSNPYILKVS